MEYDKNMIKHTLGVYDFNIDELAIDKIMHVPMHEWKVATKDKPQLYIDNLQCCVGLYAHGNGFAFLAHINTVVYRNNEYILNKEGKPIHCNRCDDLLKEILSFKGDITEPFKIGISLGITPLDDEEEAMVLINEGIDEVIKKLRILGYPIIKLKTIFEPEFILDSRDSKLITPNKNKSK